MKDPVGLAVADRSQHNRFRLQGSRHGNPRWRPNSGAILSEAMVPVTLYTTDHCARCVTAKALLSKRGVGYEEINLAKDPDGRAELARRTGMVTFPQIVIGEETIGGLDDLVVADRAGRLKGLVAA